MPLMMHALSHGPAIAQTYGPEISNISIDDGLSQNTVNAMIQDEMGFLWIGTNDGLNKFDGHQFKVFKSSAVDSALLSNNHIKAISKAENGDLWIATQVGLSKYNARSGVFERYYVGQIGESFYAENVINDLLIDRNSIWVATDKGIFYSESLVQPSFSPLPMNGSTRIKINQMTQDDHGNVWLASEEGIYMINTSSKLAVPIGTSQIKESTLCINYFDGNIWAAQEGGLVSIEVPETGIIDDESLRIERYLAPGTNLLVRQILKDVNGEIWIGTQSRGVFTLDRSNKTLKAFVAKFKDNPHIFSATSVTEIFQDKSKNIWIGSLETGIFKVSRTSRKFGLLRAMGGTDDGLSSNRVRGLIEDGDYLWIATAKGLNKYNRKTLQCEIFTHNPNDRNSIISNDVRALDIDESGNLWVGTNDGLSLLNRSTSKFASIPLAESANKIRTIQVLSDRNVWIGSLGGGISVIEPDSKKIITQYSNSELESKSLSSNNVMNIFESSSGEIWIATYGGGLNKIDSDRKSFTRVVHERSTGISKMLTSIHEDSEGYLWVGSYGDGLFRVDPSDFSFRVYTEENGLSNNVVYAAIPHGNSIWISTNHGLNKYNRLLRNISKYNAVDGLQSNEFNSGSYLQSESGELFFGGVNGLTFFYPDSIRSNELPPRPAFTDFRIYNKSVMPGEIVIKGDPPLSELVADSGRVSLSHLHNVFTVEFASLDFISPEDNRYAYQLVGFDRDWIYTDSRQRAITYTNLRPGQYAFQMKAANDDGVWNERPIVLFIDIAPALWQRWWFKILTLFTVASFVVAFVYRKMTKNERRRKYLEAEIKKHTREIYQQNQVLVDSENHLKTVNKKKDQMFYALAHHVRGPLTSLFNLMKYSQSEDLVLPERDRLKYVQQLNEKVGHSLLLLDNTYYWSLMEFDDIDPMTEVVNITQLTEQCVARHRVAALSKNISIHVDNEEHHYVKCDKNMTAIIIQNLITNAIKYSHQDESINVRFVADENKIKLVVEDTGVGMNASELKSILSEDRDVSTLGTQNEKGSGLGLQLSNRMAKRMDFNLFADCEKTCTKFYLDMPKGREESQYPEAVTSGY